MEVLLLLFGFELALALDGERVVFHANIQVLLFDARNFELQHDLRGVFINIDCGRKSGSRPCFCPFIQVAEE